MTRRRSIFEHPALPLWAALWLAALVGLGMLVLPDWVIGRIAVASGLDARIPDLLPPLSLTRHMVVSIVAALAAGLIGLVLFAPIARIIRRRRQPEWAELADELDLPQDDPGERVPRPLRVREELEGGFDDVDGGPRFEPEPAAAPAPADDAAQDAMLADADLATLVARFDSALDRFARGRPHGDGANPADGRTGDRAELRAALAHLARARED